MFIDVIIQIVIDITINVKMNRVLAYTRNASKSNILEYFEIYRII